MGARRTDEQDLRREIEDHLALETEDQMASGRSREDAETAARRLFGSVARASEDTRAVWGGMSWTRVAQDLQYGCRLLRRSPIVTLLATVSLGLGIGATAAMFSVFDALLVRTLPVPAPQQLVGFGVVLDRTQLRPFDRWNYDEYVQLRDGLPGISGIAAIAESDRFNLRLPDSTIDAGPVHVALVSGNYFSLFGVQAQAGRLLTPNDDRVPGGHPVAVVSDAYWRRNFEGTTVVERSLKLNETVYDVIGVAPASFIGDSIGHPTDVWVPMAMQSQVMIERPGLLARRGPTWLRMVARMTPGSTLESIASSGNSLMFGPAPVAPSSGLSAPDQRREAERRLIVQSAARGYSLEREQLSTPMIVVMAIVGLVLLIACANIANLQLARATARGPEMAVRSALGASRGRLIRQAFTESALLSCLGGALGLGLALIGMRMLERLVGSGSTELSMPLRLDARVLLLTSIAAFGTTIMFGVALARAGWTRSLSSAFAGRGAQGARAPLHFGFTKTLITTQVAVAMILLVGAGLFVRTLRNLERQSLGFDRQNVILVETDPAQQGLAGAGIADVMARLPEQLNSVPGVQSAAASSFAALGGVGSGSRCTVAGYAYRQDEDDFVRTNTVTPRYFETMGMTLVAGRELRDGDVAGAERVAVINEAMARYYWGMTDAVGKRFGLGRDSGNEIEVVGVVKDANLETLREAADRTAFLPYRQDAGHLRSLSLAINTTRTDDTIREELRNRLRAVAPLLPIVSMHSVDENMQRMLWTERLVAALSGLCGALALALTCVGLYGVMSYITARRTNEIGIRMALGANRGTAMRLVLAESLRQVGLGLAIGIPFALVLMRMTTALLFGVTATDLTTIAEAGVVMLVVAAVATAVPAYRVTRVSAVTALRQE